MSFLKSVPSIGSKNGILSTPLWYKATFLAALLMTEVFIARQLVKSSPVIVLVCVGLIFLAFIFFFHFEWGLLVLVLTSVVIRFSFGRWDAAVTWVPMLLVPLLFSILLLQWLAGNRDINLSAPGMVPLSSFLIFAAISIAYSYIAWDPLVPKGQPLGLKWQPHQYQMMGLFMLFIVIACYFTFANASLSELWIQAIFIAILLVSLYLLIPPLIKWLAHPYNPYVGSDPKKVLLPYQYGIFMAILCYSQLSFPQEKRKKFLLATLFAIGVFAVIISYFLSAWIGLLIGMLFVSLRRSPKLLFSLCILLLIIGLVGQGFFAYAFEQRFTGHDILRFDLWRRALQIWSKSPLFGIGVGNLGSYFKVYNQDLLSMDAGLISVHNTFLVILAETGLLGLACILWFIVVAIRFLARAIDGVKEGFLRGFILGSMGVFLAHATVSFFTNGFLPTISGSGYITLGTDVYPWLLLGVSVSAVKSYPQHGEVESEAADKY